ncbi:hypothetical protein SprV_0802538400 [Sparganum proliferum]
MTWLPPVKPNGILEAYKAECYLPNDNTPVASVQVDPQVLSVEVSGLALNTLYECAVVAFTKGRPGGQGGGQTSSKRSPAVRTWQSSPSEYVSVLGTSVTNVFEDVTTNSNDKKNNQGSLETTENETQKFTFTLQDDIIENKLMEPTESAEQAPGSSAPGLSTTEINAVDAKIIDSDEDTDRRDSGVPNGNTTSAVILNSHVDLGGDVPTAPFESKENATGSSAPGLSTTEINVVDAKIIDLDEDTDKRDTVGSDGNTTSAVIPTSDVDLGGDVPAAPFESNEDGSNVHVSAFNDSGDNLTAATIVDSENETDELDPRGSDGNKSGSSTPDVHEYSTEISSTIPVELDGHGILREKTFQPAAIILRVVGIVSLLALATGFLQGNLHIPFISDVDGGGVHTNRIFSGYLEPNSSHNASVHMLTKEQYAKKEMAEFQTQSSVETLHKEGLPPVAIAATTFGILCLLALVIGASILVNRRRSQKRYNFHIDLVKDDFADVIIHGDC